MSRRSIKSAWLCIAAAATGCVGTPPTAATPPAETISLSVGPCFGFCPVYDASISSDGTVEFVGRRHTAVLGERRRAVDARVYREIANAVSEFRPTSGTETAVDCTSAVSDTSQYRITWTGSAGTRTSATVAGGCPGGAGRRLVELLQTLPTKFGIAEWTQQTTRPGESRG